MLFKHFNSVKPVSIIKFPSSFNRHSKKLLLPISAQRRIVVSLEMVSTIAG